MLNHHQPSTTKLLQKKRRNMIVSVDNIHDFYNETKKSKPHHHQQISHLSPSNSYQIVNARNGKNQRVNRMGVNGIVKSCSLQDVQKYSVNNSLQKNKTKKKNKQKEKENGKYQVMGNIWKQKCVGGNMSKTPCPQSHKYSASALPNFSSYAQTPKQIYSYTLQQNPGSTSCPKYKNMVPFNTQGLQSSGLHSPPGSLAQYTSTPCPPHQSPFSTPHQQMQTAYPSFPKPNYYLTTSTSTHPPSSTPKRQDFKFMYQIGFGGFGKVWKVQQKSTWQYFAMKQIQKRKVIQKDSVDCIMNQRRILSQVRHQFIVNVKYAFQDQNCLYLIMDYLKGADLRYHLCYTETFTEPQTKFILACVINSLEQLHSKGIVHRDIKPENLVLEETGYVRLTDFGIAKYVKQLKLGRYDSSGTPGYMAPQVMMKEGYDQMSDLFALGVVGFQLMLGKRPYMGKNRKEIKEKIMEEQAKIKDDEIPMGWSKQSADFINKLLIRDPSQRLGSISGISSLKQHPWFSDINWRKLSKKQIVPPYIPNIVCETKEYLDEIDSYNEMNGNNGNVENKQPHQQNKEGAQVQGQGEGDGSEKYKKGLTEEENRMFQGYEFVDVSGAAGKRDYGRVLGNNGEKKDRERERERERDREREKDRNMEKNCKMQNKNKNYLKMR